MNKNDIDDLWNIIGVDPLPKHDKPVLVFMEDCIPPVIGCYFEGNIDHGEFHDGNMEARTVIIGVTAWTDVLDAPKVFEMNNLTK